MEEGEEEEGGGERRRKKGRGKRRENITPLERIGLEYE